MGDNGGLTRRDLLGAAAFALAAGAARAQAPPDGGSPASGLTIDMHSHAGRYARRRGGFEPIAEPMRAGGMTVVCLAMVADSPVTRIESDGRITPVRDPRPGELVANGNEVFGRIRALADGARLRIVTDTASLIAAREAPSIIVAAEGADFLDGSVERLDEVEARFGLRHLQLTHFRVNELGDNQTRPPVHGGLTAFGAAVVRACNRKGIVVDVAHSSFAAAKQVAAASSKPVILSHSALSARPPAGSRLISPDHARVIAGTGGVIGIWPPKFVFRDLADYAGGFARMVELVGIDHVGLGTDLLGIPAGSVFPGYQALPALATELRGVGFSAAEIAKLLGGNYARVFAATIG